VSSRILTRIAGFTLVVTALQAVAYSVLWELAGPVSLIIPSILVVTFPFAMIAAVDAIRRDHALPPHIERATALKLAVASLVFMVIFGGFVVPASNHAFRAAGLLESLRAQGPEQAARAAGLESRRYAPPRGLRERNTYELLTNHGFDDGTRYLPESVNRELHNRASLAMLPVLLLWLRWRLLDLPRRRWSPLPPTVIAILAFIGFAVLRQGDAFIEGGLGLSPGSGAWSPLLTMTLVICLDSWRRTWRMTA